MYFQIHSHRATLLPSLTFEVKKNVNVYILHILLLLFYQNFIHNICSNCCSGNSESSSPTSHKHITFPGHLTLMYFLWPGGRWKTFFRMYVHYVLLSFFMSVFVCGTSVWVFGCLIHGLCMCLRKCCPICVCECVVYLGVFVNVYVLLNVCFGTSVCIIVCVYASMSACA